ncbi:MAG: mechanosensitive ion channel family protein, partial [Candidatus Omnitrophica bacterium]|nr:mechanosensitive ion channel family protein [Candidatus Omnitrophota bacterium]
IYKVLELDLTALATSLGIITVAVAFSSQQLVQNIIAGLIISVKRPIWYDDWVEIGNSGVARVKDIVLTQTILRGIDGRIYYLPNAMLLSSSITNYTRSGFIEVPVSIAIGYHKDRKIEDIQKLILDVLNGCPKILPNVSKAEKPYVKQVFQMPDIMKMFKTGSARETFTPRVYVTDFTFPRITLSVRFWIREIQEKNQIISDFLNALVTRLKEEGVETL